MIKGKINVSYRPTRHVLLATLVGWLAIPYVEALYCETCTSAEINHTKLNLLQIFPRFFAFLPPSPFLTPILHLSTTFYARQHICYSAYMPRQFRLSVCLSVRPSVTRVYCDKTAERIIEILSLSDRPIILVFRHQGSLCKSEGVTPNGGAKYKGVAIFDQYAAIYVGKGKR